MSEGIITPVLLSLIFFYLSNLQKSFILRVAGRIIATIIIVYSITTITGRNISFFQKIKNSPAAQTKIAEKLMPQEVRDAKDKIGETFKKIEKDAFGAK